MWEYFQRSEHHERRHAEHSHYRHHEEHACGPRTADISRGATCLTDPRALCWPERGPRRVHAGRPAPTARGGGPTTVAAAAPARRRQLACLLTGEGAGRVFRHKPVFPWKVPCFGAGSIPRLWRRPRLSSASPEEDDDVQRGERAEGEEEGGAHQSHVHHGHSTKPVRGVVHPTRHASHVGHVGGHTLRPEHQQGREGQTQAHQHGRHIQPLSTAGPRPRPVPVHGHGHQDQEQRAHGRRLQVAADLAGHGGVEEEGQGQGGHLHRHPQGRQPQLQSAQQHHVQVGCGAPQASPVDEADDGVSNHGQ